MIYWFLGWGILAIGVCTTSIEWSIYGVCCLAAHYLEKLKVFK